MAIQSTPQHFKFAKVKMAALKSSDGTQMAFCLLRKKGTKEVILHLDKPAAAGRFKNPMIAHQIFKKTTAFRYRADDAFFKDIGKLVSIAGIVENEDGTLVFKKTVAGRGTEEDLKIGLKDLKVKKYRFSEALAEEAPRSEAPDSAGDRISFAGMSQEEILAAIRGNRALIFMSPLNLARDPTTVFASFEDYTAAIEALQDYNGDDRLMKSAVTLLKSSYENLDGWSPDGIEGVSDVMEALGDIDDIDAELAELEAYEDELRQDIIDRISLLHTETEEALRKKGFAESCDYLVKNAALIITLTEGTYRLVTRVKPEYGGGSLLLVSAAKSSKHQDFLNEISADLITEGVFKKNASRKKIAFAGGGERRQFVDALRRANETAIPHVIDSMDNFNTKMAAQREAIRREEAINRMRDLFKKGMFKPPTFQTTLSVRGLLDAFYTHLKANSGAENLGFYLSVTGDPLGVLDAAHKRESREEVFATYLIEKATYEINISSENRSRATLLHREALEDPDLYSTYNLKAPLDEIYARLNDPFVRFQFSDEFYDAVQRDQSLLAHCTEM